MDLSAFNKNLNDFLIESKKIGSDLERLWFDEEKIFEIILNTKEKEYLYLTSENFRMYVNTLLNSNNPNIFNQYTLNEIREMYEKYLNLNPTDISVHLDYIEFLDSILADEKSALLEINKLENALLNSLNKLKTIKNNI